MRTMLNQPLNKSILRLKCPIKQNVESFRKEIADLEIHNKLDDIVDSDPNCNYEIISTLLQHPKSKHIPKRIKKFNKHRHNKERWMTDAFWRKFFKKMTCMLIEKLLQSHSQIIKRLNSNSKATKKLFQRVLTRQKTIILIEFL